MSLIGSMFTGIRQSFRESFLGGDDDVWMETLKSDYANCDDFSDSDDEESVCSYLSAKYNNNSAPEQASPLEAKLTALPSSSAEEKTTTAKRSSGLLMDFPSTPDETPVVSFLEPLEATNTKAEEATVEAQEEAPKEASESVKEVKESPKNEDEVKENPKNETTEPAAPPLDVMSVHGTKDTRASTKEESSRSSLSMSTHSSSSSSSSQRKSRRHRSSSRRSVSLSPNKDSPGLRRSNTHSHSSPKKEQSSLGPMLRRNKTTATSSRRTSSRSPKRTSSKPKDTALKTPESLLTMSVHGTKDTRASVKEHSSSSSSKGSLLGDLSMHSTTDSQRKSRRHRSPRRSQSHSLSPKKDSSTLGSLLHRSKTTMTDAIPRLPGRSTSPSPCDKSMSNSSSRSARRRDMGALSRSTNHNEKPCFDWEAYGKVKARVEAKKERSSSADKKKGRGQQQRKPKHMSPTRRERRSPSFYSSVLGNLANDENAPQKRA